MVRATHGTGAYVHWTGVGQPSPGDRQPMTSYAVARAGAVDVEASSPAAREGNPAGVDARVTARTAVRRLVKQAITGPAVLSLIVTSFVAIDLTADLLAGMTVTHVTLEIFALCIALAGVAGVARQMHDILRKARDLQVDLQGTRADLDRWRSEAQGLLRRLGAAIEHQFCDWGLTSAEREIALLILKGLSYKEVATARGTTERTVRHQALAIFKKAGLAGRAEMAAFFLQDLLLPAEKGEAAGDARPPGSPPPPAS